MDVRPRRGVYYHTVAWLGYDYQTPFFFLLSTPSAKDFHFRILHRIPGVNIAPLVLEAIEVAPLSPTPAPRLGSRKYWRLGLF